jgi:formylglycine-generating enzyme required for sulfatase activity
MNRNPILRHAALCAAAGLLLDGAGAAEYVSIAPVRFQSVLAGTGDAAGNVQVAAFQMRVSPVTNADYRDFVAAYPQWRRSQIPRVFADAAYLEYWPSDLDAGPDNRRQRPVTRVSWFAARAYCRAEGGRLPTWNEWELVAAADGNRRDARADPAWRARILDWYARPGLDLADVGGAANAYGVRDIHGLIWEWVEDASALLANADNRSADGPQALPFCGGAALNLRDPDDFASAMRIALLSSLQAADTLRSLGFRCVRDAAATDPASTRKALP